ncbi:MAG: energy-coupling factor transporter ATPase [Eubacteriales bacterium]|nr:energy-coupling factor transporter ATPase [Eubacteriales bacterium]
MYFAKAKNLSFQYPGEDEYPALRQLNFNLEKGRHLAIVGANGSGKSSLAKLLAALFTPTEGELLVFGRDISDEAERYELRPELGIVFQNPDNQIVSTTVEEDVAFGPENLGIPNPRLRQIVDRILERIGLLEKASAEPTELSGGQKQKLALGAVLAMNPSALILDEASSMLDPATAAELFDFICNLAKSDKLSLINITHSMEEAMRAEEIFVLKDGELVFRGSPDQLFTEIDLAQYNLRLPQHLALAASVKKTAGLSLTDSALSVSELSQKLIAELSLIENLSPRRIEAVEAHLAERRAARSIPETAEKVIEVSDVHFNYRPNLPLSRAALNGVSFDLRRGEILAVLGASGAGKSTLMLHLNALLKLQQGQISILGRKLDSKAKLRELRRQVGLVFQYPESQLFAEDVRSDIGFGPKQMGLSDAEVEERVRRAIARLGLSEDFLDRSPFELSGGEMRKVALAGIVAMETEILVLDEPSAGLDPAGSEAMVRLLQDLRAEGRSLILVTHNMEDAAELADRVLLIKDGRDLAFGPTVDIFNQPELLKAANLKATAVQEIVQELNRHFGWNFKVQTLEDAKVLLLDLFNSDPLAAKRVAKLSRGGLSDGR